MALPMIRPTKLILKMQIIHRGEVRLKCGAIVWLDEQTVVGIENFARQDTVHLFGQSPASHRPHPQTSPKSSCISLLLRAQLNKRIVHYTLTYDDFKEVRDPIKLHSLSISIERTNAVVEIQKMTTQYVTIERSAPPKSSGFCRTIR